MGMIVFQAIAFGRDSSWTLGDDYLLRFTSSGNLELWNIRDHELAWESGTRGERLAMQSDGNLVIYAKGGEAGWSSGTSGNEDAVLVARNDGSLAILTPD